MNLYNVEFPSHINKVELGDSKCLIRGQLNFPNGMQTNFIMACSVAAAKRIAYKIKNGLYGDAEFHAEFVYDLDEGKFTKHKDIFIAQANEMGLDAILKQRLRSNDCLPMFELSITVGPDKKFNIDLTRTIYYVEVSHDPNKDIEDSVVCRAEGNSSDPTVQAYSDLIKAFE